MRFLKRSERVFCSQCKKHSSAARISRVSSDEHFYYAYYDKKGKYHPKHIYTEYTAHLECENRHKWSQIISTSGSKKIAFVFREGRGHSDTL